MGVPPKSSILIGISIINRPFLGTLIYETSISVSSVYIAIDV